MPLNKEHSNRRNLANNDTTLGNQKTNKTKEKHTHFGCLHTGRGQYFFCVLGNFGGVVAFCHVVRQASPGVPKHPDGPHRATRQRRHRPHPAKPPTPRIPVRQQHSLMQERSGQTVADQTRRPGAGYMGSGTPLRDVGRGTWLTKPLKGIGNFGKLCLGTGHIAGGGGGGLELGGGVWFEEDYSLSTAPIIVILKTGQHKRILVRTTDSLRDPQGGGALSWARTTLLSKAHLCPPPGPHTRIPRGRPPAPRGG